MAADILTEMPDPELDLMIRTGAVTGGYSKMFQILRAAGVRERDRRSEAVRVQATIAVIHAEAAADAGHCPMCRGSGEALDYEECGGAPVARSVACPCGGEK